MTRDATGGRTGVRWVDGRWCEEQWEPRDSSRDSFGADGQDSHRPEQPRILGALRYLELRIAIWIDASSILWSWLAQAHMSSLG
jgi:hypothetical protein